MRLPAAMLAVVCAGCESGTVTLHVVCVVDGFASTQACPDVELTCAEYHGTDPLIRVDECEQAALDEGASEVECSLTGVDVPSTCSGEHAD